VASAFLKLFNSIAVNLAIAIKPNSRSHIFHIHAHEICQTEQSESIVNDLHGIKMTSTSQCARSIPLSMPLS